MNATINILEQMRECGWLKRTVTEKHFQYRLARMPKKAEMSAFMRLLHSAARTTGGYGSTVQAAMDGEFMYQMVKPKPKPKMFEITGWPENEVRTLTSWIVRDFKERFQVKKPLEKLIVAPHRINGRYAFNYQQAGHKTTIKIGLKVKFPLNYMGEDVVTWHELYVLAFAWTYCCHIRYAAGRNLRAPECQELAKIALHRYRVGRIDMNMLEEKADYGIEETEVEV